MFNEQTLTTTKKRILCVEGNTGLAVLFARTLEADGFEVVSTTSAVAGFQFAKESRFDLYFFDLYLPGMSGVELSKSIREFDKHTPLLFISGRAIATEREQAAACELQGCCEEPTDFETLKQTIRSLLDVPAQSLDCAGSGELKSVLQSRRQPKDLFYTT